MTFSRMISIAVLCLAGVPAMAKDFKLPLGIEGTFYGHFNLGYLSVDDGAERTNAFVDNNNSNSRLGFRLSRPFGEDLTLKFNFETSLGLRQSSSVSTANTPEFFGWRKTNIRKGELSLVSKRWGTFWAGQGSMTTDNLTEIDLSKTSVVTYSDFAGVVGGFSFLNADGTDSGIALRSVFFNLDGTRRWRLRYDTPTFSDFTFGVAFGREILQDDNDNTYYDAALRYSRTFGDVQVSAGIGYAVVKPQSGPSTRSWVGSASALHEPTGLNATVAAGAVLDGGDYIHVKLGWIAKIIPAGSTAFAVEYFDANDYVIDGLSGRSYGVAVVQNIDELKTELFAGYRIYELDSPGVDYRDTDSLFVGARWKF